MQILKKFKNAGFILALSLPVVFTSCDKNDDDPTPPVSNTITDQVVANADFSLLEEAVVKASLATTLSGAGPYTVFAPNNAAFAASGMNSASISALSQQQASDIILYHALPSKVLAADVPAGPNAKVITASGDSVFVTKNASGVYVNGVKVTQADVAADNGVIHVIEKVLMPPTGNTVETAVAAGLDSLVKAVTRATAGPGGDATLTATLGSSKLTVFAPTNQAFTDLLTALGLTNIDDIPMPTLLAVLRYHVVADRAFSSDLANGSLSMLAGGSTTINLSNGTGGGPTIKGAGNGADASNITATNIMTRNGVVHLIDRVLIP